MTEETRKSLLADVVFDNICVILGMIAMFIVAVKIGQGEASMRTVRNTITMSAEVIYKYEEELPILSTSETQYIVVVGNDGEYYEIEVEAEAYDEIEIGDIKECEIQTETNKNTGEYSYTGSFAEG